jgi:beta-lactamase regulating signal transducer with metallopeptidase domain
MTWLLDTLVWTGVLIALVLVIRRPIARHFGARAAYALWSLPLFRLLLPPIVLPASMSPSVEAAKATRMEMLAVTDAPPTYLAPAASAGIDWAALLAIAWVVGAGCYVVLRLLAYARLRNELLSKGRAVGVAGRVRLIETTATCSPLAFGVFDKVVALPSGFMAQADRAARDLALAHELAHHRAHDLAANFAALPLFALHWFNPLSWLGWTAMRRDQEAACDARVIEGRARSERAFYAAVIAEAVAAPKFALAAPMACPVLGEKSIIHRLRNLTMTDHSRRRRRAGTALVGLIALALPFTASFSYAQQSEVVAPLPPEPPVAPLAVDPPLPPEAPSAPQAPDAPIVQEIDVHRIELNGARSGDSKKRRVFVVRNVDGDVHAVLGDPKERRKLVVRNSDGESLDPDSARFKDSMRALDERLANLGKDIDRTIVIDEKRIARTAAEATVHAARASALAMRMAPVVVEDCDSEREIGEARREDGRHVVFVCRTRITGQAVGGLRSARAAIERNSGMSAETRAKVLEELDREIARIESEK